MILAGTLVIGVHNSVTVALLMILGAFLGAYIVRSGK